MQKLELWIPQTTGIDVLDAAEPSSHHARQGLFVYVDFSSLNPMFSRLLKIIVGIPTSSVLLGEMS